MGRILIAEPFMADEYFQRKVVLLCAHDEEGSFGFILNKFVDIELTDIMREMPSLHNRIGIGGPVQNSNMYYIHTYGDMLPGSMEITEGIYVGGDFEVLKNLLLREDVDKTQIRFFVGYSGWDGEQLDEEISTDSWYVSEIGSLPLFETEQEDLWGIALKNMGGEFVKLANFPIDPSLN